MKIKPYGDTLGDGAVQLSFTLPAAGEAAAAAARRLAGAMGLDDAQIVHRQDLGEGRTFFIIYGRCRHEAELQPSAPVSAALPAAAETAPPLDETDRRISEEIGRKLVVVGATTGTDAHTVGLDAILNMKGFHGDFGLERYQGFEVHNLGSQVTNEELVRRAAETRADALLVSQVVTQKNIHRTNLTQLVDLLEAEGRRQNLILVCGGPRITPELAAELGYDAGFGPGTVPSQVAKFLVGTYLSRHNLPRPNQLTSGGKTASGIE